MTRFPLLATFGRLLVAASSLVAFATAQAQAQAPAWPDKPVRLIVPAPAGGGTADPIARVLADELSKSLGQKVWVENIGGANGNIGAGTAARATADGYTLLFSWAGTLATNPSLYRNLPYDARRDLTPIVLVGNVPNILVVNSSVPVKSLAEFGEYVKANPGKLNYASSGQGSSMHLAAELYRMRTGAQMVHVPYNGVARAINDMIANQVQLMFQLVPGIAQHVKSGSVRALAVMSDHRSEALPDVPTFAEAGMTGMETGTWFGILAPRGTPPEVLARVNTEVNKLLADPALRARLIGMGLEPLGGTAAQFGDFWDKELKRWAEIVKFAGTRLD
ncbi:MAG: tripartite tricarboxylate transporter substrate binding protein [Rubrivivax sp.]|nr:tripartite tricarboxylate transporter substrate binding protein [Rubrivivax sp.]MCL4697152.1 tripartite tricarboxylate transporter substrate binding protein [Burkholderiaceae bacterium]